MGQSPSKRIEETLATSPSFVAAVHATFEECMSLSQHAFPGLQLYQLPDAALRVYHKLPPSSADAADAADALSRYKQRWLPHPPTQAQVDATVRKERLQRTVGVDEFRVFCIVLFRDVGLATARRRLAVYVPLGSVAVLVADLIARRLPVVGGMYRAGGAVMPGLLLGSVVGGVLISTQLNLD